MFVEYMHIQQNSINPAHMGPDMCQIINKQDYHVVPILTKALTGNFSSLLLYLGRTIVSEKYSIWITLSAG